MNRLLSVADAEHYVWGNNCEGRHLVKTPSLSIIQEKMPPNTAEGLHYHNWAQQAFYILSGTARFQIGNQELDVAENQGVHIGPGVIHRIENKSAEDLGFLVISQPHAREDRINIEVNTLEVTSNASE